MQWAHLHHKWVWALLLKPSAFRIQSLFLHTSSWVSITVENGQLTGLVGWSAAWNGWLLPSWWGYRAARRLPLFRARDHAWLVTLVMWLCSRNHRSLLSLLPGEQRRCHCLLLVAWSAPAAIDRHRLAGFLVGRRWPDFLLHFDRLLYLSATKHCVIAAACSAEVEGLHLDFGHN